MDLMSFVWAIFDFLKLLIPLVLVCFVLKKFFNPVKENLMNNKKFGWIKSMFVINFLIFFIPIFLIYLYFYFNGLILGKVVDPELTLTFFEHILFILTDSFRVIFASIILALALMGFEMLYGITFDLLKNKDYSSTVKELLSLSIVTAIFLVLVLFVFDWVLMGLFVYVFYGGVSQLPLMFLIKP